MKYSDVFDSVTEQFLVTSGSPSVVTNAERRFQVEVVANHEKSMTIISLSG